LFFLSFSAAPWGFAATRLATEKTVFPLPENWLFTSTLGILEAGNCRYTQFALLFFALRSAASGIGFATLAFEAFWTMFPPGQQLNFPVVLEMERSSLESRRPKKVIN